VSRHCADNDLKMHTTIVMLIISTYIYNYIA